MAKTPDNEKERLDALRSYHLLDTIPEAVLDQITKAASEFCGTPIALISLVDSSRQWFKSAVGLGVSETPRDMAFCAHAILEPTEFMEVEDATLDSRFADNPLVKNDPNIRFYAGMPLVNEEGYGLGTLCVIDREPRKLTESQRKGLRHLSKAVIGLFEERLSDTLSPLGRAIEDRLGNGILITDARLPDNPITYCNLGFEKLSGYERSEIIGTNCRFLQGKDTDPKMIASLRSAIANQQECTVVIKNYRKDGTPFWNELSVSPVRNTDGQVTHFFGIQQDVTEQHSAEERLQSFARVFEESVNEIYIFDTQTLNFIEVNNAALKNLQYSIDEMKNLTPVYIKPEHTTDSFEAVIAPLRAGTEQKIEFTTPHQRKDGSTYLAEVHLQTMAFNHHGAFLAIILDVTERTKTQSDLQQAKLFLESAPDATVVVDEAGKIEAANRQMVLLSGYSRQELEGMSVDKFVPDRYRANHAAHRANFASNPRVRGMGTDLDLSAVTKDGREFPIEVSLSPIETADGTLVAAAIRDISARKAIEDALRKTEDGLRLAKDVAENAEATKTRFLAAASHDLRQPLQAVRLYLSALSKKLEEPKALQLTEKIHLSLDTMGELLEALLDISKLESGSIEPQKKNIPLFELLDRLTISSRPQIQEKKLQFECDEVDYVVYSDPALLERIIENFLTNAIRYTEQGKISIECQLNNDAVRVSVTDTGQGIPENAIETVFEEYYQLDNSVRDLRKGLGLGLSIVKHIARILDHPTSVTSVVGEGSTFSVDVPLGERVKHSDNTDAVLNVTKKLARNPVVLMVDNDLAIVDAMAEMMSAYDVEVATAENGFDALHQIDSGIVPDLVITDYRMPKMTGVELVLSIRKILRGNLPVVIMTGDTSATQIKEANLENCTILFKPVNIEQLVSLIEAIRT